MDQRVEVTARIGDTVLDVRYLASGSYRIGRAPGLELPAALATCYPIVEITPRGAIARRPAGVPARLLDEARATPLAGDELPLVRGQRLELQLGLVTLDIALVELPGTPVARPPIERRPFAFGLGVLIAHLALWATAQLAAPFVEPPHARPRRLAHVTRPAAAPPRRPEAVALPDPIATPHAALPRPSPGRHGAAPKSRGSGSAADGGILDAVARAVSDPRLIDMSAINNGFDPGSGIYDEDAAPGFGRQLAFDPTVDPRFASIPTGTYATIADGRGAGAFYDLGVSPSEPTVRLCATAGCRVVGGTDERAVRIELEQRLAAILGCYRDHAPGAVPGEIVVEFEIADDGSVRGAHGRGLGRVGPCVAHIVTGIAFPSAARATRARYPMTFSPS